MKRGFTLIEMLIVVAVMVTLMSMVFRLTSIGGDTTARNVTVSRLQRLENCLSGYYAAFGTYPPVKLHGTRDINYKVSSHGIQTSDEQEVNWNNPTEAWKQVEAACKAQPVDVEFPFANDEASADYVADISKSLQDKASSGLEEYKNYKREKFLQPFNHAPDPKIFGNFKDKVAWSDVQMFKFGLLSYLLPRYLVMMDRFSNSSDKEQNEQYFRYAQWEANNALPADPLEGNIFDSWVDVGEKAHNKNSAADLASIANIPSQAACARWMPNLEGVCSANKSWKLFGINITITGGNSPLNDSDPNLPVYTPIAADDDNGSTTDQYVLDSITVQDGWGSTLYYYSPAPHQSYVLWSAGPNGRTFPPWIPLDSDAIKNNDTAKSVISAWIEDDIINMSN